MYVCKYFKVYVCWGNGIVPFMHFHSMIPKMALPLDLRPLRKDMEDRDADGVDGADVNNGDYPAGAAFNAVRKNNNANAMY